MSELKKYRADFHIHTLLSPCGSLEMSPANIINLAKIKNIDIIGITDHNNCRQSHLVKELGEEAGICVIRGAEVTSKEEAHCLAFFESDKSIEIFQEYLDKHILKIKNNTDRFGYQVVVDRDENIAHEVEHLLISALDKTVEEIQRKVHSLDGLFIPAHVNRPAFSLTSQLGFIPPDIIADAIEISRHTTKEKILEQYPYISHIPIIQNSDAHYPNDFALVFNTLLLKEPTFEEIRKALKGEDGRKIL